MLVVTVFVVTGNLVRHPQETELIKQPKLNVIVNLSTLSDSITHIPRGLSFFDCDSAKSKCTFLYPGEFYHNYNRIISSKTEWRKTIGLDNSNLPALTSLSWWTTFSASDMSSSNLQRLDYLIDEHLGLSRNLTYIHVHKCGGTSIQSALSKRASKVRRMEFRYQMLNSSAAMYSDIHHYKHSYGGGSPRKKAVWDKERIEHIQALRDGLYQNNQTAFPVFTVLRDPLDRFVSAVQQVMHYNAEFRSKCLREPPNSIDEVMAAALRQQIIQCAMDDMEETRYRRDVHLQPMAAHFRLLDGNGDEVKDTPISIFHMNDLRHVLDEITETSEQTTSIHARDRSDENYATSPLLATLSVDDFSDDMIQQICRLYHVDYSLLKWLGLIYNDTERRCK